jgi:uncharacterized protein YjbI with pentapeptide repeats
MDKVKVDRQLVLVEYDLPGRRDAWHEAGDAGKGEAANAQQTHDYTSEKDLVRLYGEGKRNFSRVDLQSAHLQGVRLQNIRLIMANLQGANLQGANLVEAKLRGADLNKANLYNADLRKADLRKTDLRKADLRETDLRGADLWGANLLGARLTGAKLDDETQIENTWRLIWEIVNQGTNGHDPDEAKLS